jgi:hypothetical protein
MGTIPAPNIAGDAIQIAQMPQNAAAEYARAAALQQQTAASKQEMQQRALEMQAQQRQLNDQDAQTKLITQFDPNKNTITDIPKMFVQNGGSGEGALKMQQSLIAQRQNYLKMSDDQFAQEQKKADLFQGVHDAITQAAPQDKNAIYQQGLHRLSSAGIDVSKEPIEYPGDDVFAQHLAPIQLHSAFVEQASKDRQAAQENAKARLDNAQAAHQEFVNSLTANSKPGDFDKQVDALIPPTGAQGQAQNQFVKGQVNAALSRGDIDSAKKFVEQAYQSQLGVNKDIAVATNPQIQQGKVDVAKATAQARQQAQLGNYGEAGDPMIDMVGQNRIDLATALQRVPPAAKEKFLKNLGAAYPEYQQQIYATRQALIKSATSGDIGKNITAYNTAISHAQQLSQAADALNNGDMPTLNKLGNALGYQFGSDKTTNFNVIKNALSGEISKVFKGGEATDAEIKAVQEPFSAANSPAQLKGAIDNAIHLMNSKRDALKQQVDLGMQGKPNFGGGNSNQGAQKTLSQAAIAQAAKDHGVSIQEATRQAKAAGYTIQ